VVDKIMLLADGSISMFGERIEVLTRLTGKKAPPNKMPPQQQSGNQISKGGVNNG